MCEPVVTDCPLCGEYLNGSTCRDPDCNYRENGEPAECAACGETVMKRNTEWIGDALASAHGKDRICNSCLGQ